MHKIMRDWSETMYNKVLNFTVLYTHTHKMFLFFKILFIFREIGREGERERNNVREKHQWVASPMCPDQESNW